MKDFFISYNNHDRAWAEWIAWQLEAEGWTVSIQAWDFRPGSNFILEMDRATKDAHRLIVVLSPAYLTSVFTAPEWAAYLLKDSDGGGKAIVPVRVAACEVKGLLGPIVYVDLVSLDGHSAREALIAGVRKSRAKPSTLPPFPPQAHSPVESRDRPPPAEQAPLRPNDDFPRALLQLIAQAEQKFSALGTSSDWQKKVEPLLPGASNSQVSFPGTDQAEFACDLQRGGSTIKARALFDYRLSQIKALLDTSWTLNEPHRLFRKSDELRAINGVSGVELVLLVAEVEGKGVVCLFVVCH